MSRIIFNKIINKWKSVAFTTLYCWRPYEHISGHSTRVGAAQELLGEGSSIAELMLAGGWKSEVMPVQYGSKIASEKGAMAKFYNNRIEEKTAK